MVSIHILFKHYHLFSNILSSVFFRRWYWHIVPIEFHGYYSHTVPVVSLGHYFQWKVCKKNRKQTQNFIEISCISYSISIRKEILGYSQSQSQTNCGLWICMSKSGLIASCYNSQNLKCVRLSFPLIVVSRRKGIFKTTIVFGWYPCVFWNQP